MPYKDKDKQKEYQRLRQQRRRLFYRKEVFRILGKECSSCGISDERVLQLDHIKPILRKPEERDGSGSWTWQQLALGKITSDNLQVLCANCHMIKTIEDRKKFKYK